MKINPLSFKATYIHPNIKSITPENREKLKYCYDLGREYPYDIYLGGTTNGNLTLQIKRCSPYKFAAQNGEIEMDNERIMQHHLIKAFEDIGEEVHGSKYPVMRSIIYNLDKYDPYDLYVRVLSELHRYERIYSKKLNKFNS